MEETIPSQSSINESNRFLALYYGLGKQILALMFLLYSLQAFYGHKVLLDIFENYPYDYNLVDGFLALIVWLIMYSSCALILSIGFLFSLCVSSDSLNQVHALNPFIIVIIFLVLSTIFCIGYSFCYVIHEDPFVAGNRTIEMDNYYPIWLYLTNDTDIQRNTEIPFMNPVYIFILCSVTIAAILTYHFKKTQSNE